MEIKKSIIHNWTVVHLDGPLDLYSADQLVDYMHDLYHNEGYNRFIMDMTSLAYIDSAGIGSLISLQKKFEKWDGELRLAAIPDKITKILKLMRIESVYRIFPTIEAAAS